MKQTFELLTLDTILSAAEEGTGKKFTGYLSPLPSYINRVYEIIDKENSRYIIKFYRPDRWSREALQEEHQFLFECMEEEIPVIAPMILQNEVTLGVYENFYYALFPKRSGRPLEVGPSDLWYRLGSLMGRVHSAGMNSKAQNRVIHQPKNSTTDDLAYLMNSDCIPDSYRSSLENTIEKIISVSQPLFSDIEMIKVHGDCHSGNILDRMDDGLLLIDFDDMMVAPAVQDLWLLLPDYYGKCEQELGGILRGYEQFIKFDRTSLRLIEPLRAMRIIYFLTWCAKQRDDISFKKHFPHWGNQQFWGKEVADLRDQLQIILNSL